MQKKKKIENVQPKKQKPRAKYIYTTELESVIFTVNLLPLNIYLPEVKEILEEIFEGIGKTDESVLVNKVDNLFDRCFKHFPEDYKVNQKNLYLKQFGYKNEATDKRKYVWGLLDAIRFGYEYIRRTREELRTLVNYYNSLKKQGYFKNEWNRTRFEVPLEIKSSLSICNGKYEVSPHGIIFLIKDVEVDNIRFCEICNRILLAKREKSKTCSPKCLNAFRQRQFRNQNKNDINKQRKKNYYYKKKIPFCEECVRPVTRCECQ